MADVNRVWILGAGFSKALGGPLIKDLLAKRASAMLASLFPTAEHGDISDEQYRVRVLYDYGRERGYWDHAEQFLDLAESAADEAKTRYERARTAPGSEPGPKSHGATLLESLMKGVVPDPERQTRTIGPATVSPAHRWIDFDDVEILARAARRALAVDCSVFLRSAQLNTERWQPYKDWANRLHAKDTVITFNYDHVPELLAAETRKLRVVSPVDAIGDLDSARTLGVPVVLKLHGSVTWARGVRGVQVINVEDAALGNPATDFLLGVPGPGKRKVYLDSLKPLRDAAMAAIREAQGVIFVGYRFPPTDGDTRRDILGSIGRNRQKAFLGIQTVLGPKVHDDDSNRLLHLLGTAVTRDRVTQVPLYAEDYLSLMGLGDDGNP